MCQAGSHIMQCEPHLHKDVSPIRIPKEQGMHKQLRMVTSTNGTSQQTDAAAGPNPAPWKNRQFQVN